MQKLVKIWFLHINEHCKIRGRFEIIREKKILRKYYVCGSYCEKGLKITSLSFYMLISCFLALLCWVLVLHDTTCSSGEHRHNFYSLPWCLSWKYSCITLYETTWKMAVWSTEGIERAEGQDRCRQSQLLQLLRDVYSSTSHCQTKIGFPNIFSQTCLRF